MQVLSFLCAFLLMIFASTFNSTAAQAAEEPRSDHTSSFLENAAQAAEEPRSECISRFPGLDFDEGGDFVFCQITDIQDEVPMHEESFRFLEKALAKERPSLVILTGDNTSTFGHRLAFPILARRTVKLFQDAQIPFTVTFGNHDSEIHEEQRFTRQQQYDFFKKLGGSLFVDIDVPALPGAGSGAIALRQNGEDRFLLVVMDSGDYPTPEKNCYDGCRSEQIRWYEENASHLPCLWFQHIIVWDVYADGILQPTTLPQELQSLPLEEQIKRLPAGVVWCPMTQQFMRLSPEIQFTGELKEPPCPPPKNVYEDAEHTYQGRTLYQSWLKCGNMKGAFFGHDHMNTFVATDPKGITLGFTKAATLNSYNDGNPGLRFFRVHANGTYTTWQITAADLRQ